MCPSDLKIHFQSLRADARAVGDARVIDAEAAHQVDDYRDRLRNFGNFRGISRDLIAYTRTTLYHGARPEQLDRRVLQELNHYAMPSCEKHLSILPNFFLDIPSPSGYVEAECCEMWL
ncbi:hypothetical protein ACHAQJ_010720 [Trichoderma viride]